MGRKKKPIEYTTNEKGEQVVVPKPSSYVLLLAKHKELLKQFADVKKSNGKIVEVKEVIKEVPKEVIKEVTKIVEVEKPLQGNQYIYTPSSELLKDIIRCIAYLKTKNKLEGVNANEYLQVFTELCIKFTIEKNFINILK